MMPPEDARRRIVNDLRAGWAQPAVNPWAAMASRPPLLASRTLDTNSKRRRTDAAIRARPRSLPPAQPPRSAPCCHPPSRSWLAQGFGIEAREEPAPMASIRNHRSRPYGQANSLRVSNTCPPIAATRPPRSAPCGPPPSRSWLHRASGGNERAGPPSSRTTAR
jgi:hypothetical protein